MKPYAIADIRATEILDSRGVPTVEVAVHLGDGTVSSESVPSGASTGQFEAWELRDGDPNRYNGKGVLQACKNVDTVIKEALMGMDATEQRAVDRTLIELDGTPNKKQLGANAILGVSLSVAKAAADAQALPLYRYLRNTFSPSEKDFLLPRPMLNIINGGRHADNGLDFQEYHILPRAKSFAESVRMGAEIVMQLAQVLRMKGLSTLLGDEGGFAPRFPSNRSPLDMIVHAVEQTNYRLRDDVEFALDPAASEFFHASQNRYVLQLDQQTLSSGDLISLYEEWMKVFPIISIEDGCAEEDWSGWQSMTKRLGTKALLVGDDLFATNLSRLKRGVTERAANAILVKPNQIGTLTETIDVIVEAKQNSMPFVISHRSGETDDAFIADLCVAVNAPFIKAGSLLRGERVAKYNRLLEIEQELS